MPRIYPMASKRRNQDGPALFFSYVYFADCITLPRFVTPLLYDSKRIRSLGHVRRRRNPVFCRGLHCYRPYRRNRFTAVHTLPSHLLGVPPRVTSLWYRFGQGVGFQPVECQCRNGWGSRGNQAKRRRGSGGYSPCVGRIVRIAGVEVV